MKMKEYYFFWGALAVAFIAPQIFLAFAFHRIADQLNYPVKVEVVKPVKVLWP